MKEKDEREEPRPGVAKFKFSRSEIHEFLAFEKKERKTGVYLTLLG